MHKIHSTNAGLMLEQRRRRWPNITPALVKYILYLLHEAVLFESWADVVDGGPTLNQQWISVSCLLSAISIMTINVSNPVNWQFIIRHITVTVSELYLDKLNWKNCNHIISILINHTASVNPFGAGTVFIRQNFNISNNRRPIT